MDRGPFPLLSHPSLCEESTWNARGLVPHRLFATPKAVGKENVVLRGMVCEDNKARTGALTCQNGRRGRKLGIIRQFAEGSGTEGGKHVVPRANGESCELTTYILTLNFGEKCVIVWELPTSWPILQLFTWI